MNDIQKAFDMLYGQIDERRHMAYKRRNKAIDENDTSMQKICESAIESYNDILTLIEECIQKYKDDTTLEKK
jgi:hypothetical protein